MTASGRSIRAALHAPILVGLVLLARPVEAEQPPLEKRAAEIVTSWLDDDALDGVRVGVVVRDPSRERTLASSRADEMMNPASAAKLLTTAVSLQELGEAAPWTTRIRGRVEGGEVVGDLRLVGGGDPQLMPPDLAELADGLVDEGVERVAGDLVVDARLFDEEVLPPAFDQEDSDGGYRAAVGAAASNYGAVRLTVGPGPRPGEPVRVRVRPNSDGVELAVRARTVKDDGASLSIDSEAMDDGRTRLVVEGSLGQGAGEVSKRRRVHEPNRLTGYLLRQALEERDVAIEGTVRVVHEPPDGEPDPVLVTLDGAGLVETVADTNTWSNNFMAEMLLKHLGALGRGDAATWKAARERMEAVLEAIGLDGEGYRVVNGSGLYRGTHVTPNALARLLDHMAGDDEHGDAFRASLAVAGESGTLKRRLRHARTRGRVRAKTGTLDEVVSLAGYVPTESAGELVFVVLVNGATEERTEELRAAIDRLVVELAGL